MLAVHRGEERDLALLPALRRLLHQTSHLTQDQARDGRQRQFARFIEAHPTDVAELARMADLACGVLGARHEKARIEAPWPPRWRHRARDQVQAIERRR